MSITPAGGWNKPQQTIQQLQTHASFIACPSCGSDDWKSASLVHSEGLSVSKGRIRGTIIGGSHTMHSNGQLSVGGGVLRGRTRGTSQTLLSQMAAPPRKRTGLRVVLAVLTGLFGWVAGAGLARDGLNPGTVVCSLIAACLLVKFISVSETQARYNTAMETYANTKMCQRCGTFYTVVS